MLSRAHVVQSFLDLCSEPSYLEVGVNAGETFHAVVAPRKVAVDPRFLFSAKDVISSTQRTLYHEVPSDVYFGEIAKDTDSFDVIYLDGLHTFEQTLRDLLSAVMLLKPGGVIVVDDVLPNSYHAALPNPSQSVAVRKYLRLTDASWMGDVFKVPLFVQTFMQQFSYATIAENHGQTAIWRQKRDAKSIAERQVETIARFEFKDLIAELPSFNRRSLESIVALVKAAKGVAG